MLHFQGFDEKANLALNAALQEAEELGHDYIGSEHLLLGLMHIDSGIVHDAFDAHGLSLDAAREAVKNQFGVGMKTQLTHEDFTPRSKHIIETAAADAAKFRHGYIGAEHLLLAVIKEKDSAANTVISRLGLSPYDLLRDIAGTLSAPDAAGEKQGGKTAESVTPKLDEFSRDLTQFARDNKIDPVIGRRQEIDRVIQILSRRTKNNPCLVGEPGVGKTAIVEGLALKIAQGEVPEMLAGKRIVSLDLTGMVAGTKYRGEFEERIKDAVDEAVKAGNVIVFIDELHTIIGAGAAEGATDAANILKPRLTKGELQVIGATTLDEYRKHIEKDAALERRFQPVKVGEPSEEETVEILRGIRDKYEAHHKVRITDESIIAAVKMSSRYIGDRYLPDKAIDLIDEAASRVRLNAFTPPPDLKEMEARLKRLGEEKASAVNAQEFERAAVLRDEEKELSEKLEQEKAAWQAKNNRAGGEVGQHEIAQVVSAWTGIPVVELTQEESERLLNMESELHERIVGQDEAVAAVCKAIRRGRVGLKDPKRPTGSFTFLGPTGVGKTELCKTLAAALFGDENAMIKLDMSEYMEKHNVSRMVGSPPGYVDYEEGGQLTEKVRRRPYSVVLFDEIEKAHPDVFNMLLQILEDGVLTDAQGRRVDFKNTIIIMTSNLGAKLISNQGGPLGFADSNGSGSLSQSQIRDAVTGELKAAFRPEFLNRVDDIIVFRRLGTDDIREIAARMLKKLAARVGEMDFYITFSTEAVAHIADAGFDPVFGARPLRRAIQSKVEDKLSEQMLEGKLKPGLDYVCALRDGEIVFEEKTR